MLETVRDYFRYKALKYRVMTATVTELQNRVQEQGLGAMTLTELSQLEYMGKEIYQLELIAAETLKARLTRGQKLPDQPKDSEPGQYL